MTDPESLWHRVTAVTRSALDQGALFSIPTSPIRVADGGVNFLVRVVENLQRKAERPTGSVRPNPFLPCDPALRVAELSATHLAVLNKFNVVDHHLLMVTRAFDSQDSALNPADFDAAWRVLTQYPSLVFYNSGAEAGASEPHRHLQAVPLPLAEGNAELPIESLFTGTGPRGMAGLPFLHRFYRLPPGTVGDLKRATGIAFELYRAAVSELELETAPAAGSALKPYNMLLTRDWLLVVPRRKERFQTISINALGFAGALLVRTQEELEVVKARGPLGILGELTWELPGRPTLETRSR